MIDKVIDSMPGVETRDERLDRIMRQIEQHNAERTKELNGVMPWPASDEDSD